MWREVVDYLMIDLLGFSGRINETVNFFIYDSVIILSIKYINI